MGEEQETSGRWLDPEAEAQLLRVLAEAQEVGFVGPGALEAHVASAARFWAALETSPPERALDLGSGAGLPGLPLALAFPASRWVLLDSQERRGRFLRRAAAELGLADRVTVVVGRAEALAHDPTRRGSCDVVVARSFGPPAVTAECAAGFLRAGGRLVASEPPQPEGDRWPRRGLETLGMRARPAAADVAHPGVRVIDQVAPCPPRYPRRVGIPAKRPLF